MFEAESSSSTVRYILATTHAAFPLNVSSLTHFLLSQGTDRFDSS